MAGRWRCRPRSAPRRVAHPGGWVAAPRPCCLMPCVDLRLARSRGDSPDGAQLGRAARSRLGSWDPPPRASGGDRPGRGVGREECGGELELVELLLYTERVNMLFRLTFSPAVLGVEPTAFTLSSSPALFSFYFATGSH